MPFYIFTSNILHNDQAGKFTMYILSTITHGSRTLFHSNTENKYDRPGHDKQDPTPSRLYWHLRRERNQTGGFQIGRV